jgi:hypothetical protein
MLSAELAQLMQVPVLPEPVSGERAVIPFSSMVTVAAGDGGDPQMLMSVLTGLSLSDLMNLSVYSGLGLLQELEAMQAADGMTDPTNPFAAEFLHNMLSLPLPDLIPSAVAGFIFDGLRRSSQDFGFGGTSILPERRALPSDGPPPSDHRPGQPAVASKRSRRPPPSSRAEATSLFSTP